MTFEEWRNGILFKVLIVIIIAWILLAIVFGLTDLEISKTVVNQDLAWAQFARDYGEPPGHVFWICGLVVIMGCMIGKDNIKKQKLVGYILVLGAIVAFIVGLIISDEEVVVYGAFIAIGVGTFTVVTRKKDWNNFKKFAWIPCLLALINPLIFVQTIKFLAGRVRFRDLTPPNYTEYTPWFIFNGITGNKSFPSGHTASGWMLLPLLILVRNREWKDPVKILTWVGVISWGFFVGLSRIFIGAHYASDVLFSTGVASITTILLYWKFYKDE